MNTKKREARIAGVWYLLMGISSGFGIMFIPQSIMVAGDAAATAQNIIDSEWMFRLSIFSNLFGQSCFIFLVFALNRLLRDVNADRARLMVILVTAAVPMAFLLTLNLVAARLMVSGGDFLNVFDTEQRNALALLFLNIFDQGIMVIQIFWGLWLLPLGLLIIKSGFIPKILGIFLVIGCFSYLADSSIALLLPDYREIASTILMLPLALGEISIIFWLLIKGVRKN